MRKHTHVIYVWKADTDRSTIVTDENVVVLEAEDNSHIYLVVPSARTQQNLHYETVRPILRVLPLDDDRIVVPSGGQSRMAKWMCQTWDKQSIDHLSQWVFLEDAMSVRFENALHEGKQVTYVWKADTDRSTVVTDQNEEDEPHIYFVEPSARTQTHLHYGTVRPIRRVLPLDDDRIVV